MTGRVVGMLAVLLSSFAPAAGAGSFMMQPLVRTDGSEMIVAGRVRGFGDFGSHVSAGVELQGDIGTRSTYRPVIALAGPGVLPWPTGDVTRSFSAGPVLRFRSSTPGPFVVAGYVAGADRVRTHFTDGTNSTAWRNAGAGVTIGGGFSLAGALSPTVEFGHHTSSRETGSSYFSLGLAWK